MRAATSQLRKVLARGSFDSQWTADVFYDGQRRFQDVPVKDVQMDEDGTAKIQQSGSLTIVWQDPRGGSIAPHSVEDVLSPFGTELVLYQIISDGPLFVERVPMGTFVISDVPEVSSVPWSLYGRALVKGDQIKVTFKDPFYKVSRNRFDIPGITPSLSSVYGEIQRLTRLPVTENPLVPDGPIPRAMVYEEDRLDAVYELASVLDATPYMVSDGTVSLRPNSWNVPVDEIAAANAGDPVRELSPASYTAWTEQRRNLLESPVHSLSTAGWSGSGTRTPVASGMRLSVGAISNNSSILWRTSTPAIDPSQAAGSARYRVTLGAGATSPVTLKAQVFWGAAGWGEAGAFVTIAPGETRDVTVDGDPTKAGASYFRPTLRTGASITEAVELTVADGTVYESAPYAGELFTGNSAPGGGLHRTRWLGAVNASSSVAESRDIIPAVMGPDIPRRGTLIRVTRGMSAEGVYNRVVVRAQGQQAGVLAAGEIGDGPLRAENPEGADSPFGRVPYFMSSQFITSVAQALAEVRKWLPRVSRPQALVMDIDEVLNPLREVGDVVTVRRKGEVFPARVVKIKRTSDKTQTTSVMVVPNA